MSIAEKLTAIAENEQNVYNAGYNKGLRNTAGQYNSGYNDGLAEGKAAENNRFWDAFQNNGNKTDYENAFRKWADECYNPKYPIVTSSGSTRANSMFNQSTIVDTKVDITINSIGATHVFYNAASLKTIPKLIVNKDVTYTNWFTYCPKLEDITFEGNIGNNINFSDCKNLTLVSLANIVNRLHNHSTSSETHTCTLGSSNLSKIDDVFITVATQKGWTLA